MCALFRLALQLHVTVIPREIWIHGPGMEFSREMAEMPNTYGI